MLLGSTIAGAPSQDAFAKVLRDIRGGKAPSAGIDDVGKSLKIQKMVFCMREAIQDNERRFFKSGVICTALIRDAAADGKLTVRFVSTNQKFDTIRGVLGELRQCPTGADGITNGTIEIVNNFATPFLGCPRESTVESHKDETVVNAIRDTTQQLACDSASDELLSGRMMRDGVNCGETSTGFFPNLNLVIYDKAHCARRPEAYFLVHSTVRP